MIVLAGLLGALLGLGISAAALHLPRLLKVAEAGYRPAPKRARRVPSSGAHPFRQHAALGLLGALLLGYFWARFGFSWTLAALAGSCAFLLLIALLDWRCRIVPNLLVYPAIAAVTLLHVLARPDTLLQMVLGGGLAFAIFFLTAWLRPGQLGGGDVKLAALLGLAFGFPGVLVVLLIGAGTGAAAAIYLIQARAQGRCSTIPYAPFLCLGALAVLLLSPGSGWY